MARSVGDQRALGYALAARCDANSGPDGSEDRITAAAEIVGLAEVTGDRQLELLGCRLKVVALLEIGDIGAVDRALERFALVADRLRQPLYRWYVPLWRGMRALMRGEWSAAAQYGADAEVTGTQAASGNAVALTFTQWWVRQRYEGHQREAGSAMADLLGESSAAPRFTAGPRAVIAALTGDQEKSRALLVEWLHSGLPDRIRDSEWLPETAQLAQVAVAVGAHEVAERLYADLRPYAHRFCVEGIGAAFTGSVAWYLALLATFLGRSAEAGEYAAQARAAHARVGLIGEPPPLAGTWESPGSPASAAPVPEPGAALEWEGATWAVSWAGKSSRVRDSKGLRDLAILLSRPQQEVHCLELVGGSDVGTSPGPALDEQARRAYEQRIRDLQSDIDEANEMADTGRAERAEEELDALVQQLSEAFGLTGRSRATGSAAERARSAVSWRIRAADPEPCWAASGAGPPPAERGPDRYVVLIPARDRGALDPASGTQRVDPEEAAVHVEHLDRPEAGGGGQLAYGVLPDDRAGGLRRLLGHGRRKAVGDAPAVHHPLEIITGRGEGRSHRLVGDQ